MASAPHFVTKKLQQRQVILFSKTVCPECDRVKAMLNSIRILSPDNYEVVEINKRADCPQIQDFLWSWTDLCTKTVPLLFVNGVYFGGYQRVFGLFHEKRLKRELLNKIDEVAIRAAEVERAAKEEVVVRFRNLDDAEVLVTFHELDGGHDLDDGEATCPGVTWGYDPWQYDDDYDVVEQAQEFVRQRGSARCALLMHRHTDELMIMRQSMSLKRSSINIGGDQIQSRKSARSGVVAARFRKSDVERPRSSRPTVTKQTKKGSQAS